MKYGFIYIWYDRKRKMYYIGCHWGTTNDGYICSSKRMRDNYRNRPQDFKRRILRSNIEREKLLEEEFKWLDLIGDNELGKKYYNHSKRHFGHWSANPKQTAAMRERNLGKNNPMFGKKHPELWIKKMSENNSGERNPFFGKKHSEESKKKMSETRKGKKTGKSWNKGIPMKNEVKQVLSSKFSGEGNPFFGKKHSEETKKRISLSRSHKNIRKI